MAKGQISIGIVSGPTRRILDFAKGIYPEIERDRDMILRILHDWERDRSKNSKSAALSRLEEAAERHTQDHTQMIAELQGVRTDMAAIGANVVDALKVTERR